MESTADPGELTDLLDQCYGLMVAAERRFVEGVRLFDAQGSYREDGARSMVDWLTERYSMSRMRAHGFVTVARGLGDLPELAAAYESGDVSLDQLRPIVGVADSDNEKALASEMPGWSEAQCRQVARRMRAVELAERNDVHRSRFLRWFHRDDRFTLRGQLSLEDGAVVEQVLMTIASGAPKDPETGLYDPFERRAADAFVQVCSNALADEQAKGADVPSVVCHVDAATLAGLEGAAEIGDSFQPIPGETARRLMCDCRFQMVKENENGEVIGLGRTTRIVPRWLRRSLHRRDGGCRFPGCPRQSWVDRHHIQHWSKGGATDPHNLLELCRYHHRFVHEHGWRIEGDPNAEVRFVAPDGRVARSGPEPARRSTLERFGLWFDTPEDPPPEPVPT